MNKGKERAARGQNRVRFTFEEGGAIRSVEDFLSKIKALAGPGEFQLYFRGHGAPVEALVPSVGRKHYYLGRSICFDPATERKLLRSFRRHAYEHFRRIANEWETLFLARHHGLPTRLLDWTSNPLVALYFAAFYENQELARASEKEGGSTLKLDLDSTLWAIQTCDDLEELDLFDERRSPLAIPGIKVVFPFHPTPRLTAQSGVFTLHGDPWTDMVRAAGVWHPARDLDICKLIKWRVKSADKTGIVLDLERLSINSRTLFPDLEGLARGLWETEVIRRCFRDLPRHQSK